MIFKFVYHIQKHGYLVALGPNDKAFKLVTVCNNILCKDRLHSNNAFAYFNQNIDEPIPNLFKINKALYLHIIWGL